MSANREFPADALSLTSSKEHRFDVLMFNGMEDPDFKYWIERWSNGRTALVVTTPTVERIYGTLLRRACDGLSPSPIWLVLACSEASKTLESVEAVCKAALECGIERTGVLVSFGGGVCCDIVTFAASMLRRGTAHIRIPSTLVGQVDAGIGLKGGINFGRNKNYLGSFFPPNAVAIVPSLLATITRDGIRQGMAEMVKVACISDHILFTIIEREAVSLLERNFQFPRSRAENAIRRAIIAMLRELRTNPFENRSFERAVDFGHTIAHPLEAATDYRLHHGFAVAIDMAFSCILGWRLGITPYDLAARVIGLLVQIGLPIFHRALARELIARSFAAAAQHRGGNLNLVIPARLGGCVFVKKTNEIGTTLIDEVTDWLSRAQQNIGSGISFDSKLMPNAPTGLMKSLTG